MKIDQNTLEKCLSRKRDYEEVFREEYEQNTILYQLVENAQIRLASRIKIWTDKNEYVRYTDACRITEEHLFTLKAMYDLQLQHNREARRCRRENLKRPD